MNKIEIKRIDYDFTVCKVTDYSLVNWNTEYCFIGKTEDENSLVCFTRDVPQNVINAAKLDGAYMPRVYAKLIIPQLKGAMGSCITILAMYALRSFDFIVSLVGYTTSSAWTLPIWMYNEAFQSNNFAYSAAISCFLLALVLVLILPLTYWTNRRA